MTDCIHKIRDNKYGVIMKRRIPRKLKKKYKKMGVVWIFNK